ncbi:MAG: MoaD/ThiS family protein [Bacillota bacterium]
MITISARAHGNLRRFFPGGRDEAGFTLPDGSRVVDLLRAIGVPDDEVWMVSVNDLLAKQEQVLSDGCRVNIFAPVAGGQASLARSEAKGGRAACQTDTPARSSGST